MSLGQIGPDAGEGLRLLSLDGGGIRGLSELLIIEELMERVRKRKGLQITPKPADYFDLIGGTSTGGLIAILLGRLNMSAAEAIEAYEALSHRVFSRKKMKWKDGVFKAKLLERAIIETIDGVLGEGMGISARMWDEADPHPNKAFVCAVAAADVTHGAGPVRFRSYPATKNKEYNCLIWEAARATSAAPTLFKRIFIGPRASAVGYVDAALGFNNPVKQVVEEAAEVFGPASPVHCIVSVGTGTVGNTTYSTPNRFQRWLPTKLISVLKRMATDTHQVAEEMEKRYKNVPDIYHRLNVNRGLSDISLQEWRRLGDVRAHTKNYVRLTEVNRRLDSVVSSLIGLPEHRGCELGNLAASTPSAAYIMHSNIPSNRVTHFVPRETLLSEMEKPPENSTRQTRIIVLSGMGGCGKTQLALAYCEKLATAGRHIAILWIDAGSPVSIMQSYVRIARMFSGAMSEAIMPGNEAMTFVKNTISSWRNRWLVVFDNYDNPSAFQDHPIHDYLPQGPNGTILFTSRHTSAERLGQLIPAGNMELKECLELLFLRAYSKEEEKIGTEIAEALGYLALAIDQAGVYIRSRNLPLDEFLPHFEAQKERVMSAIPETWEYWRQRPGHESEADQKVPLCVFTTWELSFSQIRGTDLELQQKASFLSFAGFLNNNGICEEYFRALSEEPHPPWMDGLLVKEKGVWDSGMFRELCKEFHSLSLIQSFGGPDSSVSFIIHPLVSEWARLRLPPMDRKKYLMESIEALTSFLRTTKPETLSASKRQELVLHIKTCCRNNGEFLNSETEGLATLPESSSAFARFNSGQGLYADAMILQKQAIAALRKAHPPAHERLIREVLGLARIYRKAAKYTKTITTCKEILADAEKDLGPRHPLILATQYEIAEAFRHQGQYKEAEKVHKRCFEDREAAIGPEHPDTLASAEGLSETTRRLAQYDTAEALQRRVLASYQRQLDPNDLQISSCYHVLGAVMRDKGQYAEAEKMHREALRIREKELGKDHPETLNSVNNLALVLRDRKKSAESEAMHRRALEGRRKMLGPDHQQFLTSCSNLARVLCDQGRYQEALELQQTALEKGAAVDGPSHPYTLGSCKYLADIHFALRNLNAAKDLYTRSMEGNSVALGPEHPDTLSCVKGLADVLSSQGDLGEALKLYERCYDGRCKIFATDHPAIRECLQAMKNAQRRLSSDT